MNIVAEPQAKWITAVTKVSPKSGSFWFDYGKRHNEKVTIVINPQRDPLGRRCVDVMVFSRRSVGDVVLSAWNEYNHWCVENPNPKGGV